jgi:hypothetical protein
MPDPSRYDGRTPEPPFPTETEQEEKLYFALRERDQWMKQCLEAEAKLKAYEQVFKDYAPVRNEFKSNYSPSMIRLRWALDCPTELDRAVRGRGVTA